MLLLGGVAGLTTDIVVVFAIILVTFLLFVTELLAIDVTALLLIVVLIALEPWTRIGVSSGLSGFSSRATITVLAMFMLSEGVRRSGAIQKLSERVVAYAGADEDRQLASVLGISGLSAGVVNNTPVVAVLIPMADEIADRTGTALSKLLIPISYAAMFGGMLTLIGTSTSLLASSVSRRVIGRGFTMFEFTHLGALVLLTGAVYLFFVGPRLLPDRRSEEEFTDEFQTDPYLADIRLGPHATWVGDAVAEVDQRAPADFEIVQVAREGKPLAKPLDDTVLRADDEVLVRAASETFLRVLETDGLTLVSSTPSAGEIETGDDPYEERLAEVVVVPQTASRRESRTVKRLAREHQVSVLAVRRGEEMLHEDLEALSLRGGDTLLVLASARALHQLDASRRFVVLETFEGHHYRSSRIPVALGVVGAVVAIAAAGFASIPVAALGGVVAMVATGCLRPGEIYDAVDWSVIMLLAGVIPLGIALERSGGAALAASGFASAAGGLYAPLVLAALYLFTTLITEMISNNASVVLMVPIAVDVANQIGANAFAFVLGVTFAASTSVLTPIGYQTNLMVYGAGDYRFTDFFRIGAPLQLILAAVTTLGIWLFWGV